MSWEGQYISGTAPQITALFVDLGVPVTAGAAIITIWYPGDAWGAPTVNAAAMTHGASGVWYYNCAALSTPGVYKVRVAIVALNLYAGGSFEIVEDRIGAIKARTDQMALPVLQGTASAGSLTTITLTGGIATDGTYDGCLVIITAGAGVGQSRTILSYVGLTAIATVTRNWVVAPNATSQFVVVGGDVPAILEAGTAVAGGASSITLDANASDINGTYRSNFISITAGTGIGQTRLIGSYDGGTHQAAVVPNWTTPPNNTSVYQIYPGGRVDIGEWAGATVGAAPPTKAELDTAEANIRGVDGDDLKDISDQIDGLPVPGDATEATLLAVKAQTDLLPADPASEVAVEAAITTAEGNIRGADSDDLKDISDQIDGLGGGGPHTDPY